MASPRAGRTEKISISLRAADAASLRKRAKRLYGGNLSAVVAELAADAALLEGMHDLVRHLGGPSLSDADRARIDAELGLGPVPSAAKDRGKKRDAPAAR